MQKLRSPRQSGRRRVIKRLPPERRLVFATGIAAALPVMVATARALAAGWVPNSDQAVVATRAYDVFTSQTPLVGPWSSSSISSGETIYHPGPLLYWLLALPARLPVEALPVTMGVVNSASVIGAVALAHRRGGRLLMFISAVGIAVMASSFEAVVLSDIWNPSAPLLPFTLLIFVCWSLACGEQKLLPVAVLIASFVMQCHLILVLPALGALAVGLLGLAWLRVRAVWTDEPAGSGRSPPVQEGRRSFRRWSLAALAVAVLCWSAPLLDQALAWAGSSRGEGNMAALVDAAQSREDPVGFEGGAHAVVRAIGIPPWWLRGPQPPVERTFDIFAELSFLALASSVIALMGLVALMVLAMERHRMDVASATALALVLCATLFAATASFPNTPRTIFSYSYASWWAAAAGMWTWVTLLWSATTLRLVRARRRPIRMPSIAAGLGLAAVVAAGVTVAVLQAPVPADEYDATRTVVERLDTALPNPGSVRVENSTLAFTSAVVHELRTNGATVGTDRWVVFGNAYRPGDRDFDRVVEIRPSDSVPRGGELVARVTLRQVVFAISLVPGD